MIIISQDNYHTFYEENKQIIYSICLRYLKDSSSAEDAYQDIFVKLFKKVPLEFESEKHVRAFVVRVCVNHCLNQIRDLNKVSVQDFQTKTSFIDPRENVEDNITNNEIVGFIVNYLESLDEQDQVMYWAFNVEKIPLRTIAKSYKITISKAFRQIKKINKELKARLEKRGVKLK